jgi:branched-chain amino acid transport system permease protein
MEIYLQQLPQQLINGLTLGGVYALIAIGYSMVYGILGMLNFAHGEVYMIGGFAGWWVLHLLTRNNEVLISAALVISLMIIIAMAASALVGLVTERFAYRPLRNAPRMNLLLSALGVSIFLQNLVLTYQGAKVRFFHISALIPESLRIIEIGPVVFSFMRALVIAVTFLLMGLLSVMIKRTRVGKAMRATAQDLEAASFMGVDVNRIIVGPSLYPGRLLCGISSWIERLYGRSSWRNRKHLRRNAGRNPAGSGRSTGSHFPALGL